MRAGWIVLCLGSALIGCTTQQLAQVTSGDMGAGGVNGGGGGGGEPTFYADVLPLAQKHCASCHYPGGIGPFSMLDYDSAKAEAKAIAAEVSAKLMPPWLPSDGCRDLAGQRTLQQADIDTLVKWGNGSATAGNPADAPPTTPGDSGQLDWVDRTMKMAQKYTPPSGVTDQYQCFILDPQLTSDVDLIGYDVQPGVAQEVHHVLLYPADATEAQQLDDASPDVGWTCFGGPGTTRTNTVGGWVPGSSAVKFPSGTGIQLAAGQVLVMQVHYNLTYTTPQADQTQVQLQFATTPVALHATMQAVANLTFSVPPGAQGYAVKQTVRSPAAGTIWGTLPHAHTHATQMHVDSDAGCMIDIPAWDFHWQQQYFFSQPMAIAKGQSLTLTCTYDNPGSAPLTWGENTSDEMCLDYLYVTP